MKSTLPRVTRKRRCQICGKPDYCGYSADGKMAICMRVSAGSTGITKHGGYIHVLEHDPKFKVQSAKPAAVAPAAEVVPTLKPREAFELNEVYTDFLNQLVLSHNHRSELIRRGLGNLAIYTQFFKSMPGKVYSDAVCKRLAGEYDLRRIPGFYYRENNWHFVDYFRATGFLIPIRNQHFEIVGLQLRRDDNRQPKYMLTSSSSYPRGASSGAPPHFATLKNKSPRNQIESLIVTEGALKAQIIHEFTGEIVVGLVSIMTFDETLPTLLKTAYPNLKKVQIAFDQETFDHSNPEGCAFVHVERQRKRLEMTLREINLEVSVLSWSRSFKGFDDYLVSNFKPESQQIAA